MDWDKSPLDCYQFHLMPFRLQGAPAVFMQLINEILNEHLYNGVLVYLGDLLIYTKTKENHVKLVRALLEKIAEGSIYAKLSKCDSHKTSLDYWDIGF